MRIIEFTAILNGSVDDNLKMQEISSEIRTGLRRKLGLVFYNDNHKTPLKLTDSLTVGDRFNIILEDEIKRSIPPYAIPLKIAYEDEDLIVVDKPYGLAVISTHEHYGKSLENALSHIWGENFVYRPVNRLDRDTSGLMIVAKNQLAHSLLSKQHIKRQYIALVEGHLSGSNTISATIGSKKVGSMKRCVMQDGKKAITHYTAFKAYSSYSAVRLELETGRTHQIRVHMAHIGHPLLCDGIYNKKAKPIILDNGVLLNRQALHSYSLEFISPISKQTVELMSYPEFYNEKD